MRNAFTKNILEINGSSMFLVYHKFIIVIVNFIIPEKYRMKYHFNRESHTNILFKI